MRTIVNLSPSTTMQPALVRVPRNPHTFSPPHLMRCGEIFGAQMGHGVMANGVKILTWK